MCLFKVTISGTRKLCKIYSKLTAKTPGVCQEYLSAIVLNSKDLTCFFFFEHTSLTLPRQKFILVFTNFFLENGHIKHSYVLSLQPAFCQAFLCTSSIGHFTLALLLTCFLSIFVVDHGKTL